MPPKSESEVVFPLELDAPLPWLIAAYVMS
jgi:hypothetical protein